MKLPIAELFHSVQGEGVWTGTPMCFVRLAGCNVGKYPKTWEEAAVPGNSFYGPKNLAEFNAPILNTPHSICTTVDGQRFLCDTDYHRSTEMTLDEIISQVTEERICLTGGEPFLHKLDDLIEAVSEAGKQLHVETSGTLAMNFRDLEPDWITCCPKEGFLKENAHWVDEWKFLVGPDFDERAVERILTMGHLDMADRIYIQPINGVNNVDDSNLKRCLEILSRHPEWKLSAQLHKFINVR